MEAPVSIVIVHWNQPDACVATVGRFLSLPEVDSVLVVDNGSTDENLHSLHAGLDEDAEVIELGHNTGFGPAANRGFEAWMDGSSTSWVGLAPHDALPADDTLTRMLEAGSTKERSGLLSADVGDGERPVVDHVFGPITRKGGVVDGYEEVDYPHGTLMLASRDCLTTVGLFDERYFAYCEEADLGLRARRAGFDIGLIRGARVVNPQVNSPTAVVDYLKERNTILLLADHFGRRRAAMRFILTLAQFAIGSLIPSRRGEYWSTRARTLAIRDVLRRSWGEPPAELFEQASH